MWKATRAFLRAQFRMQVLSKAELTLSKSYPSMPILIFSFIFNYAENWNAEYFANYDKTLRLWPYQAVISVSLGNSLCETCRHWQACNPIQLLRKDVSLSTPQCRRARRRKTPRCSAGLRGAHLVFLLSFCLGKKSPPPEQGVITSVVGVGKQRRSIIIIALWTIPCMFEQSNTVYF